VRPLDHLHVGDLDRPIEQRHAGRLVLDQRALQEVQVQLVDIGGQVGHGVVRRDRQVNAGVAEGQVQIDQGHLIFRIGCEFARPD